MNGQQLTQTASTLLQLALLLNPKTARNAQAAAQAILAVSAARSLYTDVLSPAIAEARARGELTVDQEAAVHAEYVALDQAVADGSAFAGDQWQKSPEEQEPPTP